MREVVNLDRALFQDCLIFAPRAEERPVGLNLIGS